MDWVFATQLVWLKIFFRSGGKSAGAVGNRRLSTERGGPTTSWIRRRKPTSNKYLPVYKRRGLKNEAWRGFAGSWCSEKCAKCSQLCAPFVPSYAWTTPDPVPSYARGRSCLCVDNFADPQGYSQPPRSYLCVKLHVLAPCFLGEKLNRMRLRSEICAKPSRSDNRFNHIA
jgi:hypothetical protein